MPVLCERWGCAQSGGPRSSESTSGATRAVHRRRYPQRYGVSGDTQMNIRLVFLSASLTAFAAAASGQGLNPATLLKQPTDNWPTYNGDYSGRRFSPLTQITS